MYIYRVGRGGSVAPERGVRGGDQMRDGTARNRGGEDKDNSKKDREGGGGGLRTYRKQCEDNNKVSNRAAAG